MQADAAVELEIAFGLEVGIADVESRLAELRAVRVQLEEARSPPAARGVGGQAPSAVHLVHETEIPGALRVVARVLVQREILVGVVLQMMEVHARAGR